MADSNENDDKWTEGKIPTDEASRRKIIGKVLQIQVTVSYRNNIYTWQGQFKLQTDGSPMGVHLSGEISRLDTADTTQKLQTLCEENDIEVDLLDVYVDDADSVMGIIPYGYYWDGNKIQYDESRIM